MSQNSNGKVAGENPDTLVPAHVQAGTGAHVQANVSLPEIEK
jgi:hypothetical protein